MMAEVGDPGAWARVFTAPNLAKFDEPTVSGVDFPRVGLDRAWNDRASGVLHVGTYAATASERGAPTSFRISGLAGPAAVTLRCDGAPYERWRVVGPAEIEVDLDVDDHDLQVLPPRAGPMPRPAAPAAAGARPARPAPPAVPGDAVGIAGVPRPPCACC